MKQTKTKKPHKTSTHWDEQNTKTLTKHFFLSHIESFKWCQFMRHYMIKICKASPSCVCTLKNLFGNSTCIFCRTSDKISSHYTASIVNTSGEDFRKAATGWKKYHWFEQPYFIGISKGIIIKVILC